MSPELLAVFHRVCAEISDRHGNPVVYCGQPTDRFREGREMVTAGWGIGGVNHGFKIHEGHGVHNGVEILTFAHSGDEAWIKARLRSVGTAEEVLRRILPPAFGISQAVAA
jgi:hypothetical protein